jgi:hypothetical protein
MIQGVTEVSLYHDGEDTIEKFYENMGRRRFQQPFICGLISFEVLLRLDQFVLFRFEKGRNLGIHIFVKYTALTFRIFLFELVFQNQVANQVIDGHWIHF